MDEFQSLNDGPSSILARAKSILTQPVSEWDVIDGERSSISAIFKSYVIPLAAIAPIATLLHSLLFGYSLFGISYRPSLVGAITTAIISYLLSLAAVFGLSWIINALAPSFGGTPNRLQSFKVAAYGATASWIAGLFNLLPGLGFLSILGLYSLYLLYLGLPKLMKAPEEKAASYGIASIVAAFLLFLITGSIGGALTSHLVSSPLGADSGGTLTVPGAGSVDLGKLEAASKRAQEAVKQASAGKGVTLSSDALKALLPTVLGPLPRGELSASSAVAAGIGGAEAEAHYGSGAGSIGLKIVDMASLGALAGIGAALGVESSTENADGYEKVGKVDGRMTSEKWNNSDKRGSYSVMIADRFLVEAEGTGTTMEALKEAVATVGFDQLESLAHP